MKYTEIQKKTNRYQDVNKNEVKFRRKVLVNIEYQNNKQKMVILISKRTVITPPLNGMNEEIKLAIRRKQSAKNSQPEREK